MNEVLGEGKVNKNMKLGIRRIRGGREKVLNKK